MERKRILWISGSGCYIPVRKRKLGYNGGSWATSIQKELLKRNDDNYEISYRNTDI